MGIVAGAVRKGSVPGSGCGWQVIQEMTDKEAFYVLSDYPLV